MIVLIIMFTNRDYYSNMTSKPSFIDLTSNSESEGSTPIVPTLCDSKTTLQASSGPVRRSKQTPPFQPYDSIIAGKDICDESKWKEGTASSVEPEILPSLFYQTTKVPMTNNNQPSVTTISAPLPYRPRNHRIRPTTSDPYYHARTNQKARKRVNARNWSFLPPILKYWRSQEGAPTKRELGEGSSFAASRILPITGEPLHRTIPLLAARLVRHENRLDAIATLVNHIPNEQVDTMATEIEQLVMGQLEMGSMMENLYLQFNKVISYIGLLCSANNTNRDVMFDTNQALDTTRAQVMSLRRAQQESLARERDRNQVMETMAAKIMELERRLNDK